jgi:hypothetical protein
VKLGPADFRLNVAGKNDLVDRFQVSVLAGSFATPFFSTTFVQ